jgi:hypothetical protein
MWVLKSSSILLNPSFEEPWGCQTINTGRRVLKMVKGCRRLASIQIYRKMRLEMGAILTHAKRQTQFGNLKMNAPRESDS